MRALLVRRTELGELQILGPYSPANARGIAAEHIILLGDESMKKEPEVAIYKACLTLGKTATSSKKVSERLHTLGDLMKLPGKLKDLGRQ